MKYFRLLLALLMVTIGLQVTAQTKPVIKTAAKYKPPKLYTQLGGYRDTVSIGVAEAEQMVGAAIKIFDDKKVQYQISSYQFAYRKIGVTEDEQTGKISPVYTLVANLFKTTPLPPNWIQQVREQVKPGDELWFFDVIVKDAQGRVMYAPDMRFLIKP